MDDPESSSIMMLALSALLGVITLICWCREVWQERAAIRWATQPITDSADKGDGPESVQRGLRDAEMNLAAATGEAISLSRRQCELSIQDLIASGSAKGKPGQNDRPPLDSAEKGDGPESGQAGSPDADMDLAALRVSSGAWRTFPSTDELRTYVDVLRGDALRQSNARSLALVLSILVGVIGTLVILAVWLSPTPEQIQTARNGRGKQGTQQSIPASDVQSSPLDQYGEHKRGTQQSTPAGDLQPSLLGQYGEYKQSASAPAPKQPRWSAEVKKSRPICDSADDYVQIQRTALHIASRAPARKAAEFVKRKCPIITFKPGNHVSVERTETFSIDKTRSITLACVVIKDGPCAWTDASALVRIPEEAPAKKPSGKNSEAIEWAE